MWHNLLNPTGQVAAALNHAWDDDEEEDFDDNLEEVDDVVDVNLDRQNEAAEEVVDDFGGDGALAENRVQSGVALVLPAAGAAPPAPVGAGMFIGRLTRFIEHVTQADDDIEEDDYDGGGGGVGGDRPSGEDGWQQDDEDLEFSEHSGAATASEDPTPPLPPASRAEGGPPPSSPAAAASPRCIVALVDHTPPTTPQRGSGRVLASGRSVGSLSHVAHVAASDDWTRDTGNDHSSQLLLHDDVYDNEDDELGFGPIVDHTPTKRNTTSASARPPSRQNSLAVQADTADLDTYDDYDTYEDLNDEGGAGWGDDADLDIDLPPLDVDEGGGGIGLPVPLLPPRGAVGAEVTVEGVSVVDHTPSEVETASSAAAAHGPTSASVRVLLPYSSDDEGLGASTVGGDADEYLDDDGGGDDATEQEVVPLDDRARFGPVVDHTPLGATDAVRGAVAAQSGASSVAVQAPAGGLEQDYNDDDAMDETLCGNDNSTAAAADTAFGDDEDVATSTGLGWEQDDADLDQLDEDHDADGAYSGSHSVEKPGETAPVTYARDGGSDSPLVDHTPDDVNVGADASPSAGGGGGGAVASGADGPVDPSVVVLVAPEDVSRDTGNGNDEDVYDDENELDYGPVVDVTPTTPSAAFAAGAGQAGTPSVLSGANSMAVQAGQLYEDFQEDDAMDYTTALGGDTDKEDGWDQDDDDIKLDDEEEDEMALSKGPLERDEEKLNGVAMVDHTPSEMGSPPLKVSDPSVDVLNSASTKCDDSAGGNEFGLVVDQTPTTPGPSSVVRSDSVVVQAQDLDTVDESYADEEEDEEDDGGDTVDAEMPMNFRSSEAQLVDFIPNRPESRYGDASTMVAADLSEVLSEVDDMAPEEGNFGPVVDVTPPSRPVAAAAGSPSAAESVAANSTAVFAPPSVAADDLDGDEETVARGEQSVWDNQEEAPNPQSGNDEPVERVNEQLVDFLPPAAELEVTDHESSVEGREPSSEVTVGGAQSLLQPLDPKEDDFGPVVDLTPAPRHSAAPHSGHSLASTATQVTASECRALEKEDITEGATEDVDHMKEKVVVDKLPQSQVRFPVDSTGSVLGSQLAEDEEEDDSKFGPVVDHLPTPRASLAPSRGGSTVDALATVSEVDSVDDDGGDGWDDDIDVSESGISDRSALQKAVATRLAFRRSSANDQERNVSVRFEIALEDGRDDTPPSESVNQTQYFDPEIGNGLSAEQTQFFDPSSGGQTDWDEEMASPGSPELEAEMSTKSFAEADTPPSTPYRRSEIPPAQPETSLLQDLEEVSECRSCMNAHTIQCPCIQRLLQINYDSNALIGTLRTAEGENVQVDFSKLLQDEMTKRLLVEKESESLRAAMDVQNIKESLSAARDIEIESLSASLQEENEMLKRMVSQVQTENAGLQEEIGAFKDELNSSRQSLSGAEQKKDSWSARESALEAQVLQLKEALETATAKMVSEENVAEMITTLQSDLASKSGECEELNSQIMRLQLRLEESENQRRRLECDSEKLSREMRQLVSERALNVDALSRHLEMNQECLEGKKEPESKSITALTADVQRLSEAKEELQKSLCDLRRRHEEEMQRQLAALDRKSAEIHVLEGAVKTFEIEKSKSRAEIAHQRALAQQSEALAAELLSVAKERDFLQKALSESNTTVASMQTLVDEHGMKQEAIASRRDSEIAALKTDIANVGNELRQKESELQSALENISQMAIKHRETERALKDFQLKNRSLQAEMDQMRASCVDEQSKAERALHQVTTLESQVSHLTSEIQLAEVERQKSMSHLATLGRTLDRSEKNASAQRERASELEKLLEHSKEELESAKSECDALKGQCEEWHQRCSGMEAHSVKAIEETKRLQQECNRIRHEMKACTGKNQVLDRQLKDQTLVTKTLQSERDDMAHHCKDLESQLVSTRQQAQTDLQKLAQKHHEDLSELQLKLRHLEEQLAEQRQTADVMASERHALLDRCQRLEAKSKEVLDESSRKLEDLSRTFANRESVLKKENMLLAKRLHDSTTSNDQSKALHGELVRLTKDHGVLVEENEELLVQLGLLKQQLDASEEQVRYLQEEVVARDELIGRVDELSEENATLSNEIEKLEAELRSRHAGAAVQCHELETHNEFELPSQAQQSFLQSKEQIRQLEETCKKLQEESESLRQENRSLLTLQHQIQSLESSCATKTNELQERVNELMGKQRQLDESERLRNAAEKTLLEKDARILELQSQCEETEDHLSFARDQLAAAEATLNAEEKLSTFEAAIKDLESNEKHANAAIMDYEQRMKELERELNQKNLLVSRLEGSISELQFQLDSGQSIASLHMSKDLQTVHEDREPVTELNSMKEELHTVSEALHATRIRLAEKEVEYDRLKAKLARTPAPPPIQSDDVDGSRDKTCDPEVDNLRSHIVSLAVALERSETKRAEAISRLMTEREDNARSLKRLAESVKRYYHKVGAGNA